MAANDVNQLITDKGQKNYIEESARIPHFYDDKKVDTITPKEFLEKVQELVDGGHVNPPKNVIKRNAQALKGNVFRWFTALASRDATPQTFDEFKGIFACEYKVILTPYFKAAQPQLRQNSTSLSFHTNCTLVVDNIFKNIAALRINEYNLLPVAGHNQEQTAVRAQSNVDAKKMGTKIQKDTLKAV